MDPAGPAEYGFLAAFAAMQAGIWLWLQEARIENATQVETSAQRRRIETGLWRIDFETLTQYVGPKKRKPRGVGTCGAEVESVQRFFVLTREKTPGRFGHRRVVARIDLNVGAANESRALVVPAKRVVPRKTIEPKKLAARRGRQRAQQT